MWGIPGWMKRDRAEINRDKEAAIRRRTCLILFLSLFIYPLSVVLSWSNTQACRTQCTYSLGHDNNNRAGSHNLLSMPWQTGSSAGWHTALSALPVFAPQHLSARQGTQLQPGSFPCPSSDNECGCSPTPSHLTTCGVPGLQISEADPGGVREQSCLGPVSYFYSATHLIILRCINRSFHCPSKKSLCSWEGENLGVLVELNRGALHCKSRQGWALIH